MPVSASRRITISVSIMEDILSREDEIMIGMAMANRSFIGDFEVQYILDKKGIASLKAYSKTNDRYFTESDLTTQGMGILLKYDFNRWLWWRKKEKEKKRESEEKEIITNVTEQ